MHYIIAKDNLNRDYHNDKLITTRQVNQTVEEMQGICDRANNSQDTYFYTIITDLSEMNLESMYDCNGEVPGFNTFCNYTGLGVLPHDGAYKMYSKHFNL